MRGLRALAAWLTAPPSDAPPLSPFDRAEAAAMVPPAPPFAPVTIDLPEGWTVERRAAKP